MSSHGWVCVHRQLLDNPIFKNDKLFRVFMYCLLKASHSKHDQLIGDSIVTVNAGQFVTGRKSISSSTGLTEQNVRTALVKLEKLSILTIKPTNKYSVISITNWNKYQQSNQQVTSKQPTSNQQVTTNNNGNNENNKHTSESEIPKKPISKGKEIPIAELVEIYNEECTALPKVMTFNSKQKRISQLKARWNENKDYQNLDWWREFFKWCNTNPSLNGSQFDWIADLGAITNQDKFTRLIEKGTL
jgi:hypothetical protein